MDYAMPSEYKNTPSMLKEGRPHSIDHRSFRDPGTVRCGEVRTYIYSIADDAITMRWEDRLAISYSLCRRLLGLLRDRSGEMAAGR